ncbi:MAG: hypothetical protein OT477_17250 [Chloroflexi bacterium]|nr:hypothetical protein [Chloroflexota bacterium]
MTNILYILAPVVYILIILSSLWIALIQSGGFQKRGKGPDPGPIAAFFAGWVACAFSAILVRLGSLEIPTIPVNLWAILISGVIGFLIGIFYLAVAKAIIGNTIMTSIFILGSVGGSLISFFFYIVYEQIQIVFISSTVAFLFGVLMYIVLFLSQGSSGGIQDAYQDFVRKARGRN